MTLGRVFSLGQLKSLRQGVFESKTGFHSLFFFQTRSPRLVDTERFFIEVVAGNRVGSRAAAHANVAELTAAALSLQIIGVAQFVEHYRVLPDLNERLFSEIPGQGRQVSTGINLSLMRDEAHRGPGQTALGHGVHLGGMGSGMSNSMSNSVGFQFDPGRTGHCHFGRADACGALQRVCGVRCSMRSLGRRGRAVFGSATLPNHPKIMRRTGCLQLNAAFERALVKPVQHPLILFGRNHLFGRDVNAASHRYQQECV